MKRIILLMAVLCCTMVASAQVAFYMKAGAGFSTLTGSEKVGIDDASMGYALKVAWKAGFALECALNKTCAIVPSVYYWSVGAKAKEYSLYSGQYNNLKINGTVDLNYIQIPLNFQMKTAISESVKIAAYLGPYLALGVGGKTKITTQGMLDGNYVSKTLELNSFDDIIINSQKVEGYKSTDIGLNYGVNIELPRFLVGVNVDMGLKQTSEIEKGKNLGVEVMLGYRF